MAKGYQVLTMLIPDGGWAISGDDYEGIEFLTCNPISKEEFEAGFAKADEWLTKKEQEQAKKKSDLLEKLGITEDEAKLLLS